MLPFITSLSFSIRIPDSLFDIKTDEKELLKKEYNKLFKKYEHDENREYKIKQKLYQKGFDISDL